MHAFDRNRRGAGAGNLGAHGNQAVGEIDDLRLTGGIADDRGATGKRCRHHHHVGRTDRNLRESVARADQPASRRRRIDIAAVDFHVRAERRQPFDEKIDRTRADGAAARQRNAALAFACQQRPDDPEGGAHLRNQLIGSCGIDDGAAGEMDGARIGIFLTLAAAVDGNVDAVIAEDAHQQFDIGQMRHVFERQRVAGQQRGDHQRQGGILGAGNRNDAIELITADNSDTIHVRLRAVPAFLKVLP